MAESKKAQQTMKVQDETYILDKKLGYGAFSWAVLATKISNNEAVALKFTKHNIDGSDRAKRRQEQEIRTELDVFQKVRHENVVSLHGYDPEVEYEHESGEKNKMLLHGPRMLRRW